jgi:hypothetical protein
MKSTQRRWLGIAAGIVSMGALTACHDDDHPGSATPATTTENFSTFAKETFAMDANAPPRNFDDVTLVADVDTDPTAFDALLM